MKQVVILAGGKGTRLRERLGGLPKPLIDICGIPLLERQILLAKQHGFTHVIILVNHAAEHIVEYCRSKQNWGLEVACIDDGVPRGTAGATLAVLDRLADEFLVMYGDTMMAVDLTRFHNYHSKETEAAATLFLHPNDHPQDSDLVDMREDGRILGFFPYPHDTAHYFPNLVNAALYWIKKASLLPWAVNAQPMDFAKDLFPSMLAAGAVLRGYNSPEYIKDIGTPSRLDKVCGDFHSGKIAQASLDHRQAMVFLDRDGTINREVDHLKSHNLMELLPGVGQAIRRLNRSEFRCCVVTNQPVIARGECTTEDLQRIHNKMETLLGHSGAYLDRIYYCPHHPDAGFQGERADLKIVCDCRKPGTGMIDRAVSDFNIERENSWLVGDTTVDIATAHRAGLKSILVETGYAGLDYREWATPDYIVPDLETAVSFILDDYPVLLSKWRKFASEIDPGAFVLVGGQSRSGKSTFASVLRDALRSIGRRVSVISADRWIKSEADRAPSVFGRYDMDGLQEMLDTLSDAGRRPVDLRVPCYNKLKRTRVESAESISINSSDIVILEGTIALALSVTSKNNLHRFHVEIDEDDRKKRIVNEYRIRGFGKQAALEVYLARKVEEYPLIEALAGDAQRVNLQNPAIPQHHTSALS